MGENATPALLRRHLQLFVDYYHRSRTHLHLEKGTREPPSIQPRSAGQIITIPEVGGLHSNSLITLINIMHSAGMPQKSVSVSDSFTLGSLD